MSRPRGLAREALATPFAETLAVWLGLALTTLAVVVTYARLPAEDLYHVSGDGLVAGLSRAVVFLNFPVAFVAVAVALIAAAVLRTAAATGAALLVAASAAFVPFVVDQSDLDAKPPNAVPALGAALALLLTLAAARAPRVRAAPARLPGDGVRVALAALLLVIAVPWLFAELGFYAPDPILADEPSPGEPIAAVHLGHHHGTDGVLLALAALALSRVSPRLPGRAAAVVSAYLALMLAYGVGNAVQDAWLEQVVKRGTTEHSIPSLLEPRPSPEWAILLAAAVLIELFWFRRERRLVRERASAGAPRAAGAAAARGRSASAAREAR